MQWRMTAAYQIMRPSGHHGPAVVVPEATLRTVAPCAMVVGHPEWSAPQVIAVLTEPDSMSSVAMGNAPDEVTRAATPQTASVEDDGFADMLTHLNPVPRDSAGTTALPN